MKILFLLERSLLILFWVLLIFGFDAPYVAILTILSSIIHEAGHLICLYFIESNRCFFPTPDISGFRIKISRMSYKNELLCALCGPVANLVVALICFLPFPMGLLNYIQAFGIINIMTMVSNLLPIEEYDGYKILSSAFGLIAKHGPRADNVLFLISFIFSSAMCFLSLYIMLKIGEGYWIFAVFFTIMIRAVIKKQKGNIF